MSEHFITLIPTSPEFVPSGEALEKARNLFAQYMPDAREIEAFVTEEIAFVDQGQNFERVCCPKCAAELQTAWWQEAMNKSCEQRFMNLKTVTPCCGFATSLNDLDYRSAAGFARCQLRARGPQQKEVPTEQLRQLERDLGTPLRQIRAHY